MRYYGNLRKQIPITYWAMMLGTLAITGVGIAGVAGFAGFYSKDGILEAAFASGGGGVIAFWVGVFVAFLTSFYSWRLVFLTFSSEEHTSELQSLMRISYAVFCLQKKQ